MTLNTIIERLLQQLDKHTGQATVATALTDSCLEHHAKMAALTAEGLHHALAAKLEALRGAVTLGDLDPVPDLKQETDTEAVNTRVERGEAIAVAGGRLPVGRYDPSELAQLLARLNTEVAYSDGVVTVIQGLRDPAGCGLGEDG